MSHKVPYWLVQKNPIYNINRFVLQESGDFTWRVSDCEELVAPHECNNYVPKKVF